MRILKLLSVLKAKIAKFECFEMTSERNVGTINFLVSLLSNEKVTMPSESPRPPAIDILKNIEFNHYNQEICDNVINTMTNNSESFHEAYENLKKKLKPP